MTRKSRRELEQRIEDLDGDGGRRSVPDIYADLVLAASDSDAEKVHTRLKDAPAEVLRTLTRYDPEE